MPELTAPNWLDTTRRLSTPEVRQAVDCLPPTVRTIASYHRGWIDADKRPIAGDGGKSIRAALALLSARAGGGPAKAGLPASLAVELVHDCSLLHDDIIDGDEERRHRPTAWRVFGTAQAILAGDSLLVAAFEALATAGPVVGQRAVRRLGSTIQQLIAGQCADVEFEQLPEVGFTSVLTMIGNKTASLLSCAASLGAVLVDADDALIDALSGFGWHLGMAFQFADDLLGIWGDPAVTGKPVMADLRTRKKSAPVTAALSSTCPNATILRRYYEAERPPAEQDLPAMAKLIEQCGGRDAVRRLAAVERDAAQDCLTRVDMPAGVLADLLDLSQFVLAREY